MSKHNVIHNLQILIENECPKIKCVIGSAPSTVADGMRFHLTETTKHYSLMAIVDFYDEEQKEGEYYFSIELNGQQPCIMKGHYNSEFDNILCGLILKQVKYYLGE